MSSIRSIILRIWLPALLSFALGGCGDNNPQNIYSADSGGAHATDWMPSGHKAAATASLDSCAECHGGDLAGGISKVACTQCHGKSLPSHPVSASWISDTTNQNFHGVYVKNHGTASCATDICHGTNLLGVDQGGLSCQTCHSAALYSQYMN